MKVLHVLNELKPSGAEVMLRIAGPLWKTQGCECAIAVTGAQLGPFAPQLASAGYALHHFPRRRHPVHFWALRRFIREERFNVVHQHVEGAGYWYSRVALSAGAGVVRTVHNNFAFDGWLRRVRGWQRRDLAKRGVVFAAIAPGVAANERERFGVGSDLVMNWIDPRFIGRPSPQQRELARQQYGVAPHDFVVVSIGNCSAVKNHTAVLRALAHGECLPPVRYLHLGVEEPARPERALASQLGVSAQVNFAGWSPDALPALHAADAYVMPSHFEGMSIAALEALATGLPCLLADVPGLRDLARYFPNLVYCSPTAEGVRAALQEVLALSAEDRAQRTAQYPEICAGHFSAERGVAQYASLYRAVAAPGTPSP